MHPLGDGLSGCLTEAGAYLWRASGMDGGERGCREDAGGARFLQAAAKPETGLHRHGAHYAG